MSERATGFSTPHLIVDAVTQMVELFRTEIRLARAEISEKIGKAVNGVGFLVGAVVLLLAGLFIILQGVVAWLVIAGLPPHLASFLVGAVVVAVGIGLLLIALSAFRISNLKPARSLDQVNKDVATAREAMR